MTWKVVAKADNPDQQTLSTLEELTGLGRGEVLLALRRNGLTAGDGLTEDRAKSLSASLSGFGLLCTVMPSADAGPAGDAPALFRVVLTGYKPGNRARLRECLERLSGLPPEQVVLWLGRIPFVLKDGIDHESARKIRRALSEAGAMVELKPSGLQGEASRARPEADAARESRPARAPARQSEAAAGSRQKSVLEPAIEKEPPALPEPPVLEGAHVDGACPPRLRFFSPGRAASEPPVIPGKDDLEKVPPAFATLPPAISHPRPPGPVQPLSVFLHAPSRRALADASRALCEQLDFRESDLPGSGSDPVWIATVGTPEKAAELSALLEEAGATVMVRPDSSPFTLPRPRAVWSFLSWLGAK
jgi:hypothetical protein